MAPVIRIENLSFAYEQQPVLSQVGLAVADGEFLGIIGPNAGGKSTLLKIMLGLLKPQSGRVEILGGSPAQARQNIGYVPQYPAFARDFPISVEQVVLMGRLRGFGLLPGYSKLDREIAHRVLAEVGMESLAHARIGTLSGGQMQRVLLARALACEPKILMLDEPTANIDQRAESDIFDLLRSLNQRMTILVVSHDIAFISSYVRRVACLNRTLVVHDTQEIDAHSIQHLYGEGVRQVRHSH